MIACLGLSKAVLECVIFCHQKVRSGIFNFYYFHCREKQIKILLSPVDESLIPMQDS